MAGIRFKHTNGAFDEKLLPETMGSGVAFFFFFFDYDLDGRQDLLTCNGHLAPEISRLRHGQTHAQPVQLFWNTGAKPAYVPVTAEQAGEDLFRPLVGRGCVRSGQRRRS